MSRIPVARSAGLLLFLLAACSGGAAGTETPTARVESPPAAATITIKTFEFMPPRLTVDAGAAVTWTNEEDSLHTVTSGTPDARTGLFDSGEFDTGETFVYTFADVGTYAFFCDRHEFMRGEVTVVP